MAKNRCKDKPVAEKAWLGSAAKVAKPHREHASLASLRNAMLCKRGHEYSRYLNKRDGSQAPLTALLEPRRG